MGELKKVVGLYVERFLPKYTDNPTLHQQTGAISLDQRTQLTLEKGKFKRWLIGFWALFS